MKLRRQKCYWHPMFTMIIVAAVVAAQPLKPVSVANAEDSASAAKAVTQSRLAVPSGSRQSPLRKLKEPKVARPTVRQQPIASKVVRHAETLVRRYDHDGDGQLSEPEWASLDESLRVSDLDRDGFITADEFARRIMTYGRRRSLHFVPLASSPLGTNSQSAGSREDRKSAETPTRLTDGTAPMGNERDSIKGAKRYFVPTTRMPTGLADWFLESDADGDGQVTTAELATGSSAETIAQFSTLDTNGDGVITASESLQARRGPSGSGEAAEDGQPPAVMDTGRSPTAPPHIAPR